MAQRRTLAESSILGHHASAAGLSPGDDAKPSVRAGDAVAAPASKFTIASTSWRSMVEHETARSSVHRVHRRTASPRRSGRSARRFIARRAGVSLLAGPRDFCRADAGDQRRWRSVRSQAGEWQATVFIASCSAFSCGRPAHSSVATGRGAYTPDRLPDRGVALNSFSLAHDQHRTLRVTHDVAGIGAEEISLQRWPMRHHHDQVGVHQFGFFEHFVIDAALAHDGA